MREQWVRSLSAGGEVFLSLATFGCSVRERNPKRPEQLQKLLLNKEAVAWHTQRTPESTAEAKRIGEWKRRGTEDLEEMVRSDKVRGTGRRGNVKMESAG